MGLGGMADLSDSDRAAIVSEFILDAPPGEFNEVFNGMFWCCDVPMTEFGHRRNGEGERDPLPIKC